MRLFSLLVLAPLAYAGPRHNLTPAEARAIAAAAIDVLVPDSGRIDARLIHDRVLIIDESQIARAMGTVTDGAIPLPLNFARTYRPLPSDQAIRCTPPHDCWVIDDGIYVTISAAALVPETGEVRVRGVVSWADILWGHGDSPTTHHMVGFAMDLYLARGASGWYVARRGSSMVG